MLQPVSRDTLTRQAADTIKQFILHESLETGTQLPSERELSETLAVSRNIIREALSALVSEGIIVKHAGKGTFVAKFDHNQVVASFPITVGQQDLSLRALREARAALEIGAIGLMVQRITNEEIEALQENLRVYEQKHSQRLSTIKEDIEFHVSLLQSTKNEVIMEMVPLVKEVFRRTLIEDPSPILHNPERIILEHQRIIEALINRDIAAARTAMHDHFRLQDFPI